MTSDAENEKRGELAGRADGRCWAEHTTEHDDLRRVAAIVNAGAKLHRLAGAKIHQ
jgi:hypothetical protein